MAKQHICTECNTVYKSLAAINIVKNGEGSKEEDFSKVCNKCVKKLRAEGKIVFQNTLKFVK